MSDPRQAVAHEIASRLLSINAVALSPDAPFTWASGRVSPVYCDNRLTLGYPDIRRAICSAFAERLALVGWRVDAVVGTATAGIPHAAWLAEALDLPMAYVRGAAKGHGKGNRIEGHIPAGAHVVVVEDLVSTGMSSTAVVAPLVDAGLTVSGILAIFTYALDAADRAFAAAGIPLETLSSYPALVESAGRSGSFDAPTLQSLESWYRDPAAWSVAHGGAG